MQFKGNRYVVAFTITLFVTCGALGQLQAAKRIIGANSPNGGAYLVKHFRVPAGAVIVGVEFVNNDPRTVFPKVALLRGPAKRIADMTLLAEVTAVRPISDHRARIAFAPIAIASAQDLYVAVGLPPSGGVRDFRDGAGIMATQLDTPKNCYFVSGEDGNFGAMDVEYELELLYQEAGKVSTGRTESEVDEANLPVAASATVWPNPFNPAVTIEFGVPRDSHVELTIYNIAGRLVRSLANGQFPRGTYTRVWDGRNRQGQRVVTGLYISRLRVGDDVITQKLVLTK